jgi:hypothetical protein
MVNRMLDAHVFASHRESRPHGFDRNSGRYGKKRKKSGSAKVDEEAALYDDLRNDRIRPRLRLEQERIGYRSLCAALATTVQDDSRP